MTRRHRQCRVEVTPLEGRCLMFAGATATVTPDVLFPPNGRFVPVTVTGQVIETNKRLTPTASFQVIDEYRRVEPSGPITLVRRPDGNYDYSFTIRLQARRATQYPAGRRYYIIVAASDSEGGTGPTVAVQVPRSLTDRGDPPQVVPDRPRRRR